MKNAIYTILGVILLIACQNEPSQSPSSELKSSAQIIILGIAQDAGYPQIQCQKQCCQKAWNDPENRRLTASIALIDHHEKIFFIVDATPDFKEQLEYISQLTNYSFSGILLTHAHIGHYTGLMHLGREAMGAKEVPVYCMPRMKTFLEQNGPWSQLVDLENISLQDLKSDSSMNLSTKLTITPRLVPHRDEFSETVGFLVEGANKTAWYIPDIDKWQKWNTDIREELDKDYLLLDGTFYQEGEIAGRNMSDIPHPFIEETMLLFDTLEAELKEKVLFIHLNHTNPALWSDSVRAEIKDKRFGIAEQGQVLNL